MRYFASRSASPWRTFLNQLHRFEKPLAGIFLTAGLATIASSSLAQGAEVPVALLQAQSSSANLESGRQPLPDGVYLYGQSPEPNQIGAAYMVFEVTDRQIVGAFYMPQSSFDCFHGDMQADQLALTVVNSYEQTAHPYAIALEQNSSVAAAGDTAIDLPQIEGYHPISTVSDNDQQILTTCRADYQGQSQTTN